MRSSFLAAALVAGGFLTPTATAAGQPGGTKEEQIRRVRADITAAESKIDLNKGQARQCEETAKFFAEAADKHYAAGRIGSGAQCDRYADDWRAKARRLGDDNLDLQARVRDLRARLRVLTD